MATPPLFGFGDAGFGEGEIDAGTSSDYVPTLTEDLANLLVRRIVRETLAMDEGSVRPQNTIGPVGSTLYATVLITNIDKTGWDDDGFDNAPTAIPTQLHERIEGMRRVMASIQFYKSGANVQANRLQQLIQGSAAQTIMIGYNMMLCRIASPVRNMSAKVDTVWEDRAGLDIEFYTISRTDTTVDTLADFPFTIQNQ